MGVAQPIKRVTEGEYLEIERNAETKSEFFEGELFAMAGGSPQHSLIAMNAGAELRDKLKGRCVVFNADLRVKIEATGLLTYPDVSVVCGPQQFFGEDTLLNPTLLVEVLSDSTEAYDRGKKFEHYRQIPSLREYLLVSQSEARIEQFTRLESGFWLLKEVADLDAKLEIPALGITIFLAEVFANVNFTPTPIRGPIPSSRPAPSS